MNFCASASSNGCYVYQIPTGQRIRQLRMERCKTIAAVAAYCGVSPQAVGKWERGEALPSIHSFYALGAFFDVTIDSLLVGTRSEASTSSVAEMMPSSDRTQVRAA